MKRIDRRMRQKETFFMHARLDRVWSEILLADAPEVERFRVRPAVCLLRGGRSSVGSFPALL